MSLKTLLKSLLLLLITCNCFAQKSFDYGTLDQHQYSNTFFNFNISIPSDWAIQNKEQMKNLTDKGKAAVAGDNKEMKQIIDAAEVNSASLLAAFKYEMGTAVQYNPGLMILAENIKNYPGMKKGSDYLFSARKLMEQSQMKYSYLDKEFAQETIASMDFYKMNATITYMGMEIKQVYYSTVLKGFSLMFIISYIDDAQKTELQTVLHTLKPLN